MGKKARQRANLSRPKFPMPPGSDQPVDEPVRTGDEETDDLLDRIGKAQAGLKKLRRDLPRSNKRGAMYFPPP